MGWRTCTTRIRITRMYIRSVDGTGMIGCLGVGVWWRFLGGCFRGSEGIEVDGSGRGRGTERRLGYFGAALGSWQRVEGFSLEV
jgi:hypothetical protein